MWYLNKNSTTLPGIFARLPYNDVSGSKRYTHKAPSPNGCRKGYENIVESRKYVAKSTQIRP